MKKNVGSQLISAQLIATADGADVTSGTTNVAVEIDGAAGTGGTATHIANGKWEYAPIQADTNGDYLTFQFTNTSAVSVTVQVYTIDAIQTQVTGGAYALDTDANGAIRIVDGTGAREINTNAGAIALVDLVTTTTTNTDMRGTDSAALASVATEARLSELDAATAGKAANQIDIIQTDTTTDIPALIADVPTVAEFNARTLVAASYFDPAADTVATVTNVGTVTGNVDGSVGSVTGAVGSVTGAVGSVTAEVTADVTKISGSATAADNLEESTETLLLGTVSGTPTTTTLVSDISVTDDDQFKGRIIIFRTATDAGLVAQATDITGCTASTNTLTFTALTVAPTSGDTILII